jgi:hypothetical protein
MKTKTSSKKVPTPFSLRQIAHRLFPLGSIHVLVALTACCNIEPGTRIVSNTLAPDCTYDGHAYYQFGGDPSSGGSDPSGPYPPYNEQGAAKFTARSSGNLATVYLGLHKAFDGGDASVFLCSDAAGSPNIATQTLLGTVAPTEEVAIENNKSLVSLRVTGRVPVVKGLDYWLVVKPAALVVHDGWNLSLPAVNGSRGWRRESYVTWHTHNDDVLPAFRITAWLPLPWANFFRVRESPSRVPE